MKRPLEETNESTRRAAIMPIVEDWLDDYALKVYSGVLGKIIGVYLGRPVENWSYDRIRQEFGQIDYYVHAQRNRQLVITDDDISGTFTFLRALQDYGYDPKITAEQIGQTWLNYLIEKTTILWWGGLGNSTEHTAFLRLKRGHKAPESGSIALNSKSVAEQIGSQIFIEGWGMVAPGDPEMASSLAARAASVSHDGEAIYAAQVVAALTSAAFVESNMDRLLDISLDQIPDSCVVRDLIDDLRNWHSTEGDWRVNRDRLEAKYGYDRFPGNVPIIPNHGLIILSLLHGEGDFHRSLSIVNTSGWDTDCNSGNVGCILGVRGGLAGIDDGPDWRGPVADRLFVPSADPGRSISDAVRESVEIINAARGLRDEVAISPKDGARFHFSFPGSVQGFRVSSQADVSNSTKIRNENGCLSIGFEKLARGSVARVQTATFIPPELKDLVTGYVLVASPTLYPGQLVRSLVRASEKNNQAIRCRLVLSHYDSKDELTQIRSPQSLIEPGEEAELQWRVPETGGYPVAEIGFEIASGTRADGELHVEYLTWDGIPETSFSPTEGTMWGRAWAKAMDRFEFEKDHSYEHLAHNDGIGLLIQGCREWKNYTARATIIPKMMRKCGLAFRVQGLRRYLALTLKEGGVVQLIQECDGPSVIFEDTFAWKHHSAYEFEVSAIGDRLLGSINGLRICDVTVPDSSLDGGAIGILCDDGCIGARDISIGPVSTQRDHL